MNVKKANDSWMIESVVRTSTTTRHYTFRCFVSRDHVSWEKFDTQFHLYVVVVQVFILN